MSTTKVTVNIKTPQLYTTSDKMQDNDFAVVVGAGPCEGMLLQKVSGLVRAVGNCETYVLDRNALMVRILEGIVVSEA